MAAGATAGAGGEAAGGLAGFVRRDGADHGETVRRALEAVRVHFGMHVAYVSEFVGDRAIFRHVDAPGLEALIKPGDSHALDEIYCRHILEGRLPELMPDTGAEPLAAAMPITAAVPIGAHMSVPVRRPDGSAYGMFCCLSVRPDRTLNRRDIDVLRAFAEVAGIEIHRELAAREAAEHRLARIRGVLEEARFTIVYQPIRSLETQHTVGLECLARFPTPPARGPDEWFAEAVEAGLGAELELAAIRMALNEGSALPSDLFLSVNISPQTVLSPAFPDILAGLPKDRIVLELTEHRPVDDYGAIVETLQPLRAAGLRVAVDDAGAGYASMRHILFLRPDLIKLDRGLTRHIDVDPVRRALAAALIGFASETSSRVVAEGIETAAELGTLVALGVHHAQGYLLGRPVPIGEVRKLLARRAA